MSNEIKSQLYMLKGMVSDLPKEDQDVIYNMVSGFHTYIDDYRKETGMKDEVFAAALAIFSCEMQLRYLED